MLLLISHADLKQTQNLIDVFSISYVDKVNETS